MKSLDIMEITKVLAHLTIAIIIASHLVKARILLRDRRTVGNLEAEGRTITNLSRHRHDDRHQRRREREHRAFTIRDNPIGNPSEDHMAPATTRVIARLSGFDLSPTESRDTRGDTNREEEQGSMGHSTEHPEGSGFTDNANSTNVTTPAHSNCTHCIIRDEIKRLRIETIKSEILSKLRLRSAPNVSASRIPSIPLIQEMMEEYEMQRDAPYMGDFGGGGETDDYHSKTMKVVNFATPILVGNSTTTTKLRFDFSFDILDSTVTKAKFYVYIRHIGDAPVQRESTLLLLYQILNPKVDKETQKRTVRPPKLIGKQEISLATGTGKWYHFHITQTVQKWIKHPKRNVGLKVECNDFQGNPLAIIVPRDEQEELYKPFVQVSVEESNSGRRKREMTGLQCKENDIEKNCCRYPLVVDFEEFKWDWIIAPKNYHANFCSGECPFVFLQQYPHTHLVQQSNPLGSTGPCCTATKLSPISMLYFDNNNNIILGKLPGMTVDRCGCS